MLIVDWNLILIADALTLADIFAFKLKNKWFK